MATLRVAKDSVYRWINKKGLPAHRVGRLFRFKLSEIDEQVPQDNQQEAVSKPIDRAEFYEDWKESITVEKARQEACLCGRAARRQEG